MTENHDQPDPILVPADKLLSEIDELLGSKSLNSSNALMRLKTLINLLDTLAMISDGAVKLDKEGQDLMRQWLNALQDIKLDKENLDTMRQWFNALQVIAPCRLERGDYIVALALYRNAGLQVPSSIANYLNGNTAATGFRFHAKEKRIERIGLGSKE
jgi:hypothetical protein